MYAPIWREVVGDSSYEPNLAYCTIEDFAKFVVSEMVVAHHDLTEIGWALERLYTEAMVRDDESMEGLLTVGFLENMISAADELGLELTRIEPLLVGARTRAAWAEAIAWQRPDHVWEPGVGAVATIPIPRPVGTNEVHRGRVDRDAGVFRVDARLIAGRVVAGCVVRRTLSKGFYTQWEIEAVRLRSPDVPSELELDLVVERGIGRDEVFEYVEQAFSEGYFDDAYWQIAEPVKPG